MNKYEIKETIEPIIKEICDGMRTFKYKYTSINTLENRKTGEHEGIYIIVYLIEKKSMNKLKVSMSTLNTKSLDISGDLKGSFDEEYPEFDYLHTIYVDDLKKMLEIYDYITDITKENNAKYIK